MRTTKLVFLLTVAVLLALLVLQNRSPYQVRFLWLDGEVSGIVLWFLTAVGGFIIGLTTSLLVKRKTRPKQKKAA